LSRVHESLTDSFLELEFDISENTLSHERKVYSVLDLFGDLGGVIEILMLTCAFLIEPLASHSFLSKAFSLLFLAKTEDHNLF